MSWKIYYSTDSAARESPRSSTLRLEMIKLPVILGPIAFLRLIGIIYYGYVLSVMWGWFVVPAFADPNISVAQTIGIVIMVRYVTIQQHYMKDEREEWSFGEEMFHIFEKPSIVLFVGWVVHLFM